MAVVLATPPFIAFYDNNGNPLAGGLVYTYAAGTNTPKATFTDSTGTVQQTNPIVLDSAGRATWWIEGAYKYVVTDSLGTVIKTTDNVTSFNTLADSAQAFFQSFSGDGTTTSFTLSQTQGTDEKALMVFVNSGLQEHVANGSFATDTIWTKGAGWTIGSGVATATGAISTAISQTSLVTVVAGQAYAVTYTITQSAGSLTPSVGGQSGVARSTSGTYREVIVAGTTQTLAFTGSGFTGTLDNVSITVADSAGFNILAPSDFTINGTALTFTTAPAVGINNIYVFSPSSLVGAASASAGLAESYATAALASQTAAAISASSAAAYAAARNQWTFSSTTTMANPSTGNLRFNNATVSLVTQIAISDLSANVGNPDLGSWIATWDDAGGTNRGSIFIFKDNSNFAIFNVNSASTDNTTWFQVPVTYVAGSGSFTNLDAILIGFAASGTTIVTGGITALTSDVTASGSGSVAATIRSSVNLTGVPTAATATVGTSTTQIATTAFVNAAHPTLTNSLGADVLLNNTALYFDGPSVAQGTSGTWLAIGNVTVTDTGGPWKAYARLSDGTTTIASVSAQNIANAPSVMSLAGVITSPAGNLRISVRDTSAGTGRILFNETGNSRDSTIIAIRLA